MILRRQIATLTVMVSALAFTACTTTKNIAARKAVESEIPDTPAMTQEDLRRAVAESPLLNDVQKQRLYELGRASIEKKAKLEERYNKLQTLMVKELMAPDSNDVRLRAVSRKMKEVDRELVNLRLDTLFAARDIIRATPGKPGKSDVNAAFYKSLNKLLFY